MTRFGDDVPVTYQDLVEAFLSDDVQGRHPKLNLINPHFDPLKEEV